jgi:hypothetical protein
MKIDQSSGLIREGTENGISRFGDALIYLIFNPVGREELTLVDFASKSLPEIHCGVLGDQLIDDLVRFSIMEMTWTTNSLLPQTRFTSCIEIPGDANRIPKSVFENQKEWIREDVKGWKQNRFSVSRPFVYMFLGRHTYRCDWRTVHRKLTRKLVFLFSPNIFYFGTNDLNPADIHDIALNMNVWPDERGWEHYESRS